jgi:hypothetical protein
MGLVYLSLVAADIRDGKPETIPIRTATEDVPVTALSPRSWETAGL